MTTPTVFGRGRKPCIHSLGSLTTIDAFECVSDGGSEVDTVTEDGTLSNARSEGPEPAETVADSDVEGLLDDGSYADTKAILASLGFADGFADEPLLCVESVADDTATAGEGPSVYRDLFWRRFYAEKEVPGTLTEASLAKHAAAQDYRAVPPHVVASSSAGDWLGRFKRRARVVPLQRLAGRVFGDDVSAGFVDFVGGDSCCSVSERCASGMDVDDSCKGDRVIGSKRKPLWVLTEQGRGRRGFFYEDEVTVSTPNRSTPPQSGPASECSDDYAGALGATLVDPFSGAL